MLRFTDNMPHNKDLEAKIGFGSREEEFMRRFFLDRVAEESILSGQAFTYLHYAEMIANGYHRTMPCPFQRQGLLLNPNGDLFYCENSAKIGNALETPAAELYFRAQNLATRETMKRETCPTCLSPCQVNVGAMKQVVPYVKFLRRAYRVKRDPARHAAAVPDPVR
jgi:sulfatase maturation enzyme AslB (radical SAM superfamily)